MSPPQEEREKQQLGNSARPYTQIVEQQEPDIGRDRSDKEARDNGLQADRYPSPREETAAIDFHSSRLQEVQQNTTLLRANRPSCFSCGAGRTDPEMQSIDRIPSADLDFGLCQIALSLIEAAVSTDMSAYGKLSSLQRSRNSKAHPGRCWNSNFLYAGGSVGCAPSEKSFVIAQGTFKPGNSYT